MRIGCNVLQGQAYSDDYAACRVRGSVKVVVDGVGYVGAPWAWEENRCPARRFDCRHGPGAFGAADPGVGIATETIGRPAPGGAGSTIAGEPGKCEADQSGMIVR
jgi:hypothetical protein